MRKILATIVSRGTVPKAPAETYVYNPETFFSWNLTDEDIAWYKARGGVVLEGASKA